MIIDIGANTTSVTPVWDGFVLTKGEQRSLKNINLRTHI